MELVVHKSTGEKTTKKVNLNKDIFGIEPNDHAIYLDTKLYLANQRQGTSSSKERGRAPARYEIPCEIRARYGVL